MTSTQLLGLAWIAATHYRRKPARRGRVLVPRRPQGSVLAGLVRGGLAVVHAEKPKAWRLTDAGLAVLQACELLGTVHPAVRDSVLEHFAPRHEVPVPRVQAAAPAKEAP